MAWSSNISRLAFKLTAGFESKGRRSLLIAGTPGNDPALLRTLLDEAETELRDLENASAHELVRQDDALRLFAQKAVDDAIELLHAQFGNLQVYDH